MTVHHIARSGPNPKHCAAHTHDAWELVLNTGGRGTASIGQERIPFGPGTITLCPPGIPHGKEAEGECFEDIFATFSDPRLPDGLDGLVYQDDSDGKVQSLMNMAMSVYYSREPGWQEFCGALMEAVLQFLFSVGRSSVRDDKARALQNEIIRHFHDPDFTVEQAMETQPYCRDYLCRCFKRAFGVTPVKYLNRLRLQSAREQLRHRGKRGLSISEIAYLSGFYDSQYFSRLYRREMGNAPSEEPYE